MFLLLIQVAVPLLLLVALASSACTRNLKLLQAAAVFFYLLAVHLAGLWLDLPWWTPWILWVLYTLSLLTGWRSITTAKGPRWTSGLAIAFWASLAITFAWLTARAARAVIPPADPLVELSSPLPPGRYLVANGGNSGLTNAHLKTLHPRTPRQAAYRGQSYGVDIVGLTPFGRTSGDWKPRRPERYAIFGKAVLAPCTGVVRARLDGRPDLAVPITDEEVMAGNYVVLVCGKVQVLLAHLRNGSVAVRQGQMVRTGQKLGEVGNSGNTDQPHLHIHTQRPGEADNMFGADPLPFRIDGRYLVRGDRM